MGSDPLPEYAQAMNVNQEMWTPLEAALAPFKELAALNRQRVTDADGEAVQIVLKADRCRVQPAPAGADPAGATIDIGFAIGREAYGVRIVGTDYRRDGRWDFDRLTGDISAALASGALTPGDSVSLPGARS